MKLLQRFFKLIIIISFSAIINACVINQQANNNQDPAILWQYHQNELKKIDAFQLTGSIAYFSEKSRYYGRFYINQQAPNEYQIKLTTPVGNTIFSLIVTPYLAEFTDHNGIKYHDENVERLVERLTGMNIPLKALSQWLIGFSDNNTLDQLNPTGTLYKTKLTQDDQMWNITIEKYTTAKFANKTIALPSTIELVNQEDKLRITINNWKLN